jgi:hypothetical protein
MYTKRQSGYIRITVTLAILHINNQVATPTSPPSHFLVPMEKKIKHYTTGTPSLQVKQPLGILSHTAHTQRTWTFTQYNSDILNTTHNSKQYYTKITSRHDIVYTLQSQPATVPQKISSPITPYLFNIDTIFCCNTVPIKYISNTTESPLCQKAPLQRRNNLPHTNQYQQNFGILYWNDSKQYHIY